MAKTGIPLNPFSSSPTTRTRWIPEMDDRLRPSFDKLRKDLKLEARARSEGEDNRPPSADKDLDEPQRQVVAYTQDGVNLLKQFLASQLHDAQEQMHARRPRVVDTELALSQAMAGAAQAKQAAAEDLGEARMEERLNLRGFRKFRRDNNITRKAAYADVLLLPVAMILLMVAIDAACNAFLFMNATEGGLAAGAGLAGLCSLILVGLGLCCGVYGLRPIGHVKLRWRLAGLAVTTVLTGLGIYWITIIGHFRDALAQNGDSASFATTMVGGLSLDWLGRSSIESIGLMLIGLIIFVSAMFKGRGGRGGLTDSYWGYKPIDYARREAEGVYKQRKDAYRAAVAASYDEARTKVRAMYEENEANLRVIREAAEQAFERAAEVRDSIGEWIAMGSAALRLYREENIAVRTVPAPAYFASYPSFTEMTEGMADTATIKSALQTAIDAHAAAGKAIVAFERVLVDEGKSETERFLDEVADIENKVDARLNRDWSDDEEERRPAPVAPLREAA